MGKNKSKKNSNSKFESCVETPPKKVSFAEKLETAYLTDLFMYTWNSTTRKVEESYFKYSNKQVHINFDEESTNNFNYIGSCEIEKHSIFINVKCDDNKDRCLIILVNNNEYEDEYDEGYFNIGLMLSYGRRRKCPEAKSVLVSQKRINANNNSILSNLIKQGLLKNTLDIDVNFLLELSKKI